MASEAEVWHLVEARRDDGTPAMFRIRELEPRLEQPRIFVVEVPYPPTALSRLPDAASYRRVAQFEEQWVIPACQALGWTFVAAKTEDGSFFLYLYGNDDPMPMIQKLSPFDGALGFFDEEDPNWEEYAALRELLDEANAMPPETREPSPPDEELPPGDQDHDESGNGHPAAARRDARRTTSMPFGKAPASKPDGKAGPAKPASIAATKSAAAKQKQAAKTTPAANKAAAKTAIANKAALTRAAKTKPAANKAAAKTPAANKAAPRRAAKTKPAPNKAAAKTPAGKKRGASKPAARKPIKKR
jgi:hypothetical protein